MPHRVSQIPTINNIVPLKHRLCQVARDPHRNRARHPRPRQVSHRRSPQVVECLAANLVGYEQRRPKIGTKTDGYCFNFDKAIPNR